MPTAPAPKTSHKPAAKLKAKPAAKKPPAVKQGVKHPPSTPEKPMPTTRRPPPAETTEYAAAVAKKAAGAADKPAKLKLFRVLESCIVNFDGHRTMLRKGAFVNPDYYGGPQGIERMTRSGVKLEPVKT